MTECHKYYRICNVFLRKVYFIIKPSLHERMKEGTIMDMKGSYAKTGRFSVSFPDYSLFYE